MTEARYAILEERGILAVSGADRREFLQGLVSNDMTLAAPGTIPPARLAGTPAQTRHGMSQSEP